MKPDSQIQFGEHFNWEKLHSVVVQITDHAGLKMSLSCVAYVFQWVFGGNVEGLITVTSLIFIDTLTGAYKAWKKDCLSSDGFFRFALKCAVYMILIATASLVDKTLVIGFASVIMITFLAVTEAISIMENLHAVGFPVPQFLLKRLRLLKEAGEDSAPTQDGHPPVEDASDKTATP